MTFFEFRTNMALLLAFASTAISGAVISAEPAGEPVMIEKPLWELGLGAGALVQPHYPSSSEYQVRGLGLPYVVYRGDILRIGDGQSARAVAAENSLYELSLSFDAAFDAESDGNELREGMPDLDFIFEIGPQMIFHLQKFEFSDTSRSEIQLALQARAAFSTDFGRVNHHGYVFEPMLRYRHYGLFHPQLEGTVSLKPLWATRDVHGYFFDVANEFGIAGREPYRASGGYFGTGLNFSGTWHINNKARMFVGIQTSFYQGAENIQSPLFEKKFNAGFAVGLVWSLIESKRTVMRI
ncbi:MAG: MipA/OmpV family protein [Pseudohongiella sp.]|nr:MipA/OmpV family protein [Pseudohongiella sp.]MDO9519318.1 MipA/OmpV family protein [Pseudohongiella sp.]MDP2126080.1 MipA/OmpV family protein [Pseudohongiella sp.]